MGAAYSAARRTALSRLPVSRSARAPARPITVSAHGDGSSRTTSQAGGPTRIGSRVRRAWFDMADTAARPPVANDLPQLRVPQRRPWPFEKSVPFRAALDGSRREQAHWAWRSATRPRRRHDIHLTTSLRLQRLYHITTDQRARRQLQIGRRAVRFRPRLGTASRLRQRRRLDLLVVNGHVILRPARCVETSYSQRALPSATQAALRRPWRGAGDGLREPGWSRCRRMGDLDNDGGVDVVITHRGAPTMARNLGGAPSLLTMD